MIVSLIAFLIIFSIIVISHEFGHFAIARRNGIRCLEFDIGMGPTLWHRKKGDTDFCIKALPLGGACIFDGLNGLEQEKGDLDEHAFPNAGVWSRIATTFAGPCANFIVGFIFALIIVAFCGTDLPVVQKVMDGSAAQEAGIQAGDTITSINGNSIHVYREVSLESMLNYGTQIRLTYLRDGVKNTVTLTPKYSQEDDRYYIGLQGGGQYVKCNALQVFQYGFYEAQYWFRLTYKSIGLIFSGHFSKDDVSGPVGVVKVVDDTYNEAKPYGLPAVLLSFLNIATLLSINLGVVNLLPLPALDGGRLVFMFVEVVRGKPVPPEKEGLVHLAGVIALAVLMVFVMVNDFSKFFR